MYTGVSKRRPLRWGAGLPADPGNARCEGAPSPGGRSARAHFPPSGARLFTSLRPLTLLLLAGCLLTACASRQLRLGHEALDEGNTTEAIHHYLKAVKKDPENAEYLYSLGQAYVRAGGWSAAVESLNKAAASAPERPDVLEQLGFALSKMGDLDASIDVYWRLFTLQKHPQATLDRLRPLLEARKRTPEVVEAALLVSQKPRYDPQKLFDLAREYHRQGLLPEAEKLFTRALQLRPNQAGAWRTLGEIRLRIEDGAGASDAFQKAFKQDPKDVTAAVGSAAALRKLGQVAEAVAIYERVVDSNPDLLEPRASLVELYLLLGRGDEAVIHAREAFVRAPTDPRVQALKGASHLAKGEYDKAIYALGLAERNDERASAWVTRLVGEAYLGQGERATARLYLVKAASRNPEDGPTHLILCRLDLEDGREESGTTHCKLAMKHAPELKDPALALMMSYYEEAGRIQRAVEVESAAAADRAAPGSHKRVSATPSPGRSAARETVADLQTLREHLLSTDEATRSPREWYELGEVSRKLDDLEGAEKALHRAWSAEDDNIVYHERLAQVLLAQGKFDSALVHYKDIIREDERHVSARLALVQAYLGRGSAGDALEVLRELRELAPKDARVYELTAEACFELGMDSDAARFQKQAVELRKK